MFGIEPQETEDLDDGSVIDTQLHVTGYPGSDPPLPKTPAR